MNAQDRDDFVELEFTFTDEAYPAVRLSQQLGCRLTLLDSLHSEAGETTAFFHVEGGDPDTIIEQSCMSPYGETAHIIERFNDEYILKLRLERSLFGTLTDLQVPLQSLVVSEGAARFVVTVPPSQSSSDIIEAVRGRHPSTTLVTKQQRGIAAPFVTRTAFQAIVDETLTDRQLDALYFAFKYGYFERPRGITQKGLAAKMGISPSTFGQHLHAALRKLLEALFANGLANTESRDRDA